MELVTADRLKQLLRYEPDTGNFYRLIKVSNQPLGLVLHTANPQGYLRLHVDGRLYQAHRLAWLYVNGCFPVDALDHIDGVKSNNRIANLRECSPSENGQNLKSAPRSRSGYRGVYWIASEKRWKAVISVNRKTINLGGFKTAVEASAAYEAAKKKHHPFSIDSTRKT